MKRVAQQPNQHFKPQFVLGIKTKKYQLPVNTFVKIGMVNVIKTWWYAFFVPIIILLPAIIWPKAIIWLMVAAVLVTVLYLAFWAIQFYGLSQVPQGKPLFEKYYYEINNNEILLKKNEREGSQLKYEQFVKIDKQADAFIIHVSRLQFFYLPFQIFQSDNDLKMAEAIFRRKKLLA